MVSTQAEKLEELFFTRMGEFLTRTLDERDLTPVEKQYWIQSGLVLSPLMATCTPTPLTFASHGPLLVRGPRAYCSLSLRARGHDMGMLML